MTNLCLAWVDYKKAFDMVPHSWLLECLNLYSITPNVVELLRKSMKHWRTELTAGGTTLGEVNIRRGIFQGDSLSPLLFVLALIPLSKLLNDMKDGYHLGKNRPKVNHLLYMDDLKLYGKDRKELDTLIQTVRVFSKDIGMSFGIEKCAMIQMKRGKFVMSEGIELPDGAKIRSLDDQEGYKYLGILQFDDIKHKEVKEKVKKEYARRVRKILKSQLNAGNVIQAINARSVSIIRYSAGILDWTKLELQELDRKTRKLLNIYRALHPQSDVDRLYWKRAEGGRGLLSVEECVKIEQTSIGYYISNSNERLLAEVGREGIVFDGGDPKDLKKS